MKSQKFQTISKETTIKYLSELGILDSEVFVSRQYLHDQAVRLGATSCISIRGGVVDLYFDKNDQLVGTSTQSIKSFQKYRGPQNVEFKFI